VAGGGVSFPGSTCHPLHRKQAIPQASTATKHGKRKRSILAEILTEAIEQRVDRAIYQAKMEEEAEVRESAIKMLTYSFACISRYGRDSGRCDPVCRLRIHPMR
jgi:hypothetical protein